MATEVAHGFSLLSDFEARNLQQQKREMPFSDARAWARIDFNVFTNLTCLHDGG